MLSKRLRELRHQQKLTQRQVAEYLNITREAYTQYETGARRPDLATTEKIADLFDVSMDSLLGRKEKTPKETYQVSLTEKDRKEIQRKAEGIKSAMMNAVDLAFNGKPENEETFAKVMEALEEGMTLAKKEAKEKYTPKKYRKQE